MKTTSAYNEKTLENSGEFTDPFYKRFKLRARELKMDDKISKTYQFPTFYGDVTAAMAIFLCSLKGARELMLHPGIQPVVMGPGKSLVVFSCYEYKHVMGVPSYNEIAMTIPVMVDPVINVPVLPMLMDKAFPNFGYYVFSMPVTSLENQIRGLKIWGLPKVVREIDIYEKDGDCVCAAREESGEQYVEVRVPMSGKKEDYDVCSNLYSRLGDSLLQSRTCFKAAFNVNKFMGQLFAPKKPGKEFLKIEDTPSGRILKRLEIDEHPFQTRFARHMTACFDLPNESFKSPIRFQTP